MPVWAARRGSRRTGNWPDPRDMNCKGRPIWAALFVSGLAARYPANARKSHRPHPGSNGSVCAPSRTDGRRAPCQRRPGGAMSWAGSDAGPDRRHRSRSFHIISATCRTSLTRHLSSSRHDLSRRCNTFQRLYHRDDSPEKEHQKRDVKDRNDDDQRADRGNWHHDCAPF